MSMGMISAFEGDFTRKMEKALGAWETLVRHHMRAGTQPLADPQR